jgi:prepilin-type processing-associated H-X9-DG protein
LGRDAASRPLGDPNIGVFGYDRRVAFADVKDGTSNTVMILESARDFGLWAQGGFSTVRGLDTDDKPYFGIIGPFGGTHCVHRTKGGHSSGSNALYMDGSARCLSDTISPEVIEALVTIAGGEKIPKDY